VSPYPETATDRDRWIVERRGRREKVDPERPHAFLVEQERNADGEIGAVATIFLTNRECPWRCAMCDLWRHTLTESLLPGAIPKQIAYALSQLPPAQNIKLYNSGSFFDRQAIPPEDYETIAAQVSLFDRVIVESHPALIGENCFLFQQILRAHSPGTKLEVAMGLETAHPEVLAKLNKRMTLDQYAASAERLRAKNIDLRAFVLVQPPFMPTEESLFWTQRSIDFAFQCGATAISLLPTRAGNGAMDEFEQAGHFVSPKFRIIEEAQDYGIELAKGRVFVDLWDIDRLACCPMCRQARIKRLQEINLHQKKLAHILCDRCGGNE
jgi:radical SAM enzyme (TIGR01210 family)